MAIWMVVGAVLDGVCSYCLNVTIFAGRSVFRGFQVGLFAEIAGVSIVLWVVHALILPSLALGYPVWRQGRKLAVTGIAFAITGAAAGWVGEQIGLVLFAILLFSDIISDTTESFFGLLPSLLCGIFVGVVFHLFFRAVLPKGACVPFRQNVLGVMAIYVLPFAVMTLNFSSNVLHGQSPAVMKIFWWAAATTSYLPHLWFVGRALHSFPGLRRAGEGDGQS